MMTDQSDADYEARRAKVTEEVKKLLAKAAATEFDEERETFENAAAKKMARWMINEAELRAELGVGAYGAGEILEEFYAVLWEDGCGIQRAELACGVARVFGVCSVIMSTYDPLTYLASNEKRHVNIRVSLIGTRAGLDATQAILPEQLVQCDAAANRAWDARLAARAKLHDENSMNLYGYFRPPSNYAGDFAVPSWTYRGPWGAPTPKTEAGLCNCGCGTPVDAPRERWSSPSEPYTYTGQNSGHSSYGTYRDITDELTGKLRVQRQSAQESAAGRLAVERGRFMKSFISGWAQRVEERLKKVHQSAADTPEEQDDMDRMTLVLKADADRAEEELRRRYQNLISVAAEEQDMAARSAGWSDAAGADLGGQRFDGGYGGRRGIEA